MELTFTSFLARELRIKKFKLNVSFKTEYEYDYIFFEWGSCYTESYETVGQVNNFAANLTGSYSPGDSEVMN